MQMSDNLHFDDPSKQIVFFFFKKGSFSSSRYFLKEIENMFSVFLSSYRNTRESLGELEKAVETLACGSCSHSILVLPNFHSCFYNSIETRHKFSIS